MQLPPELSAALAPLPFEILGALPAPPGTPGLAPGLQSLWLLAPKEPGFWAAFCASAEAQDGAPDPLDRWSVRLIGGLAARLGGQALFPFGGPPHYPFFDWALQSGACAQSPVQLLVHPAQGLWVSFRGALALPWPAPPPPAPANPCADCIGQPCKTACPAQALTPAGYDLATCHSFLDSPPGQDCLSQGCAARRACPLARAYARMPAQSAYHMRQFHP